MDVYTTIADYLVIIITLIIAKRRISHALWNSRSIYLLIVISLYVFPIFLDYVAGFQDHYHWGFYITSRDNWTRIIYDCVIIFTLYGINNFCQDGQNTQFAVNLKNFSPLNGMYYKLLYFFMILPALGVLILMRNPNLLYTFQWRELELYAAVGSYSTIEKLSYFGIVCAILVLFDPKKKILDFSRVFGLIFILVNICIQGKRGLMFFGIIAIMVVCIYHFLYLKAKKRSTFIYTLTVGIVTFVGCAYIIWSSIEVKVGRGYDETASDLLYTSTRIDLFREDRVKMAIYAENNPDKIKILDYRGQTIITDIVNIVPFNYISEAIGFSEGTYQVHFSMAMFHRPYNHKNYKANRNYMTCTLFAELISNFGIVLGVFLFIFITIFFSKASDMFPYTYSILITLSYVLLNLFDFTYIVLFLEITLIFCFYFNKKKKLSL